MSSARTLLDTNVLSEVMKQHPKAVQRAAAYLESMPCLSISIITRYEVRRGLAAKAAAKQMAAFDVFCDAMEIVQVDEPVVTRASEVYAYLRRRGVTIGDADVLIAATALVHGMTLATHNVRHFEQVPGLVIDDWLV